MKSILLLAASIFLGLTAWLPGPKTAITGQITDAATGEVLIGANVAIAGTRQGAVTDPEGRYRLEVEPGTYTLEISYVGYEIQRIIGVVAMEGEATRVDIGLKAAGVLEEVVVTGYNSRIRPLMGKRSDSKEIRSEEAPVRYMDAPVEMKAVPSKMVEVSGIADDLPAEMPATEPAIYSPKPGQPAPRAGLLTAGEWNDLHNWNTHWVDLLRDGEIDAFQNTYGFFPRQRYTVLLTNETDYPLVDIPVTLYNRWGEALWQTRTDNTGKAELWAGLYKNKEDAGQVIASAVVAGKTHNLGHLQAAESGINRKQINHSCGASRNVDIVWAVDATGSMGDELEYLKTELLDVIGRVRAINPELAIRMGSVFYRDKGDDYIVKSSGLTPDIEKTVEYIRQQSAGGGGDYPEAVHSALEEAIYRQKWSTDAVARICFLVLDASPHQAPEVLESIRTSIREAAKLGIRIVPVSGSGIQKDTEFLMKFFGLATNGSYVFLTDHSGVGGKHLEPTTDEYKVEPLNTLLVRLITEYTTVESCEGKVAIRFDDSQQQPGQPEKPVQQALYYPNPASTQFNLELPFDAQKVTLYNAEGKSVRDLGQLASGTHTIPVHAFSAGFYTLRIWKDGQVQSGKLMVVRM